MENLLEFEKEVINVLVEVEEKEPEKVLEEEKVLEAVEVFEQEKEPEKVLEAVEVLEEEKEPEEEKEAEKVLEELEQEVLEEVGDGRELIQDPFSCDVDLSIIEEHHIVRFEIINLQIKLQESAIFNIAIHTSKKTVRYHQVIMCNAYYKNWQMDCYPFLFIRYFLFEIFNGHDIVYDPSIDFYSTRAKETKIKSL